MSSPVTRTNIGYVFIAAFQLAAILGQWLILGTLTENRLLLAGYALGLGLAPAGLFALALSLKPAQSKAVSMLTLTPGGILALAAALLSVLVLIAEVPILLANGWSAPAALMVLFGTQLPAGYFCTLFTMRSLRELVDEKRIALWIDSSRRIARATMAVEMLRVVQSALSDFRQLASGSPEVLKHFDTAELRAINVTTSALNLLETQPKYAHDDSQLRVFEEVGGPLKRLPYAPRPKFDGSDINEDADDDWEAFRD